MFAQAEWREAMADGRDIYDQLLAEMPESPTDLLVLPYFAPTGPPYFDEHPIGVVAGLTLQTNRGVFIKGLLEGVTYYFRQDLEQMASSGIAINELRATGGGARSNSWLQISADVLGRPLLRPVVTEAGALGATVLAGSGCGVYTSIDQAVAVLVRIDRTFEPDPRRQATYAESFARYQFLYPFAQSVRAVPGVFIVPMG